MTPSNALPVLRASIAANVPAGQEPIPKLLQELWKNRTKTDVYNKLLERLHARRDEFLNSLCRFKFDPKALLQILVDYKKRFWVENFTDKAACLIKSAQTCFNTDHFEFSLMEEIGHQTFRVNPKYPQMMLLSMPHCRDKKDILQILNDLNWGIPGGPVRTKILEEIAVKDWVNSPEIARAFLIVAGQTDPNLNLRDALKKAVLLLLPKNSEPPAKLDSDHSLIIQTLRRVLKNPPNTGFLKSLIQERPKWGDFFSKNLEAREP